MKPLSNTIREQRTKLNISLRELARQAGCAPSYISAIENHKLDNPPSTKVLTALEQALQFDHGYLQQIAQWFTLPLGVRHTLGTLVQKFDHRARRPDGSIDLDYIYSAGYFQEDPHQLDHKNNIDLPNNTLSSIPLINKVAAGYPTEFTDLDYPARIADEYIPTSHLADPDAFAARVVGDSMSPDYKQGDIVIFSPALDPVDGMDCFVRLLPNHDTTFKRVYFEDDMVRLTPINSDYQPRTLLSTQIAGLYPAVQVTRPIPTPPPSTSASPLS